VVFAFGVVEGAFFAAGGEVLEAVLVTRALDFVADGTLAFWVLPVALAAAARPEAAPLEFFRVFWDIRLPFVAFSGAFRESGE
jgi:hypothetical protein